MAQGQYSSADIDQTPPKGQFRPGDVDKPPPSAWERLKTAFTDEMQHGPTRLLDALSGSHPLDVLKNIPGGIKEMLVGLSEGDPEVAGRTLAQLPLMLLNEGAAGKFGEAAGAAKSGVVKGATAVAEKAVDAAVSPTGQAVRTFVKELPIVKGARKALDVRNDALAQQILDEAPTIPDPRTPPGLTTQYQEPFVPKPVVRETPQTYGTPASSLYPKETAKPSVPSKPPVIDATVVDPLQAAMEEISMKMEKVPLARLDPRRRAAIQKIAEADLAQRAAAVLPATPPPAAVENSPAMQNQPVTIENSPNIVENSTANPVSRETGDVPQSTNPSLVVSPARASAPFSPSLPDRQLTGKGTMAEGASSAFDAQQQAEGFAKLFKENGISASDLEKAPLEQWEGAAKMGGLAKPTKEVISRTLFELRRAERASPFAEKLKAALSQP